MNKSTKKQYGVSGLILLAVLFSFFGWVLEMVVCRIEAGRWVERGFLSLPICPIYGACVLTAYLLLGTPNTPRGLLRNVKKSRRTLLYLLCSFAIPSGAELLVGWFFDKTYHVKLWTYSAWKYNLYGYVCLPVSLLWAVLLFLVMRYAFPFFEARIQKIPRMLQRSAAAFFTAVTLLDGAIQLFRISILR
ncbi:MAG: putative ABC transporter permease [Clostridia bacterium]|nr:putative ABC transporter permease [Clostridia bacterium]